MNPVRVAVNGYGVIGKRLADAARQQGDMELVGIVPSHQGPDAKTVDPELDVVTVAVKAAHRAGRRSLLYLQVFNQAIVVPETIDAIRAFCGIERSGPASIAKTDHALGLVQDFLVAG